MVRQRIRRMLVLPVFAVLLAGCSASTRNCTLIGASSGVGADLRQIVPGLSAPAHAKLCVGASCVTGRSPKDQNPWTMCLPVPGLANQASVNVTLTVTQDRTRHVILESSLVTPSRKVRPNGPGCPPTVYQAYVTASASGALVPVIIGSS